MVDVGCDMNSLHRINKSEDFRVQTLRENLLAIKLGNVICRTQDSVGVEI